MINVTTEYFVIPIEARDNFLAKFAFIAHLSQKAKGIKTKGIEAKTGKIVIIKPMSSRYKPTETTRAPVQIEQIY